MHVIQLARAQWLVIDNEYRARFLIVEGPLVLRETGETHVKHRVEWWSPDPAQRHTLTVCDGLLAAETWCRDEILRRAAERRQISKSVERKGF
ncbi:hypothetical protein [uncultured Microbacterium sp.]|uniref:hypothetical protein n=1 Tax=uncultured Microbacterium sp. TaxID=191216 RepID=UPI0025D254D6|nr:hypothetical protein [uncultured Microbacterium sp.]